MFSVKKLILVGALIVGSTATLTESADAGPLLDWLRGRRSCNRQALPTGNNCCGTQGVANPALANVAPNAYGLQPGQCARTCQQTCARTVVNYVPQTCYRTSWKQVPVTQYKPVTNSDPCTGCTVTCMRPCTTYSYQMQRVPYTTYRPVYRTETYKVPVTTITNDCATGNCGSCNTCPTGGCPTGTCGGGTPAINYAPTPAVTYSQQPATTYSAPAGSLSTGSSFQASPTPAVPADITPSLNSVNPQGSNLRRPVIDQVQAYTQPAPRRSAPSVMSVADRISDSTVRREWSYSPVRFASHRTMVEDARDAFEAEPKTYYRGSFQAAERAVETSPTRSNANSGWETIK